MSIESQARDRLAHLAGILRGVAFSIPAGKTRDLALTESDDASMFLSRTTSEFLERERRKFD